jgi:SAM-dependent methyltransferase
MLETATRIPSCPITGAPAKRLVQTLDRSLLIDLWRFSFGVSVASTIKDVASFALWESPAGLMFFDPPVAGGGDFYRAFYDRIAAHDRLAGPSASRPEFALAASFIANGARLLDVGCGEGGFRRFVPAADYTGLDLHFGGQSPSILAEPIEGHAATHPGYYDVVSSFQVIEHVSQPLAFARAMAAALRPGGLFLLGVPCWPSPMISIPNFMINAPPHHLSWWNERALRALCAQLGLRCRQVEPVGVNSGAAIVYWMGRLAPNFGGDRYFKDAWSWHLGLLWSYLAGACANAVLSPPANAAPLEILLVAEKP